MVFKFQKYNSIENSYRENEIEKIMLSECYFSDWVVTEKIHGSNLGIYCDGKICQTASRNNMLDEERSDSFFKFGLIKNRVYNDVKALWDYFACCGVYDVNTITVYGELFGGSYDHNDVECNIKVSQVQKGVFYTPNLDFWIFDIAINGEIVSYNVVIEACEMLNIPYCKVLYSGKFDDCLKYPNDKQTTIPNFYGLPEIEDNIMEGVVLKPIVPYYFKCGSRVILKNKNDRFKEKQKQKKKPSTPIKLSDIAKDVLDELSEYINENRLNALISKFGKFNNKQIGQYIKEFTSDVFEDARKDGVFKKKLEKSEQRVINKFVSTECRNLILKKIMT